MTEPDQINPPGSSNTLDNVWATTKEFVFGVTQGLAVAGGVAAVSYFFTRGAKETTEEAARAAVGGPGRLKPF